MKKYAIGFIMIVLIILISSYSFGSGEISKEDIESIIEEKLKLDLNRYNIIIDYEEDNYSNKPKWNVKLTGKEGNSDNINIIIEENNNTINIIKLHRYRNSYYTGKTRIDNNTAKKIANDFFEALNPNKVDKVKCVPNDNLYFYETYAQGPIKYRFKYIMEYKGIPFPQNMIEITVNGGDGNIDNYFSSWESIELPSPNNIIDKKRATELLRGNSMMSLIYKPVYKGNNINKGIERFILIYYPEKKGYGIDAKTGEFINYDMEYKKIKLPLDVLGKVNENKPKKVRSKEKAKLLAKKYLNFKNDSVKLKSIDRLKNSDLWNIRFNLSIDEMEVEGFLQISSNTGKLINYHIDDYNSKINSSITWEEGLKTSLALIGKFNSSKRGNIEKEIVKHDDAYYVNGEKVENRYYKYYFRRVLNGIPVGSNGISVRIDKHTGNITDYNVLWNDLNENLDNKIISKKEALNRYFKKNEVSLRYILINNIYDDKKKLKLVYTIYNPSYSVMDAKKGVFIDYKGNIIE